MCCACGHAATLQSALIGSRCRFVLPSATELNRSQFTHQICFALTTKLLNYSMSCFISKRCQIHIADAVFTYLSCTLCVLRCPLALNAGSCCPCIMCQHSVECVPGCAGVTQNNSCMLWYFCIIVLKLNISKPQSALLNKKALPGTSMSSELFEMIKH